MLQVGTCGEGREGSIYASRGYLCAVPVCIGSQQGITIIAVERVDHPDMCTLLSSCTQIYPENPAQAEMIVAAAMKVWILRMVMG